jgi:hypothetical protein
MIHLATATHDAFDGPEIATVVGQLLVFAGVLVSVIYGRNANQNAKAARAQVENDHKTNFREDADEKHDEQRKAVAALQRGQDRLITEVHAMRSDMGEVKGDVGLLKRGWETNRHDIDDLMDTAAQERRQRAMWGPPPSTRRERRENRNAW